MGTLLDEIVEVIGVAERIWLAGKAERLAELTRERRYMLQRDQRLSNLALLSERRKQVDEIDARIELLVISPDVPRREHFIAHLKRVRHRLLTTANET